MGRVFCALMLAVGSCCPAWGQDPVYEGPVYFADAQLKEVVKDALWLWDDPTPTDMLGLTSLKAAMGAISDLTGLEYATNLTELELHFNHISDITPLAGLTELRRLVINNNLIGDISALAGLTNLRHLDVHDNLIGDISALAGLTKLQTLVIRLNAIGDLSPLAALTDLEDLDAHMTDVSDVSPLAGLTRLRRLILQFNHISDLSGLAGLTELRELNLRYNRISDVSPLAGLSNLEDLNLLSNEISDIEPLTTMTNLKRLNLEGNPNLDREAYRHHLYTIAGNGTSVQYSAHTSVPTGVVVKDYTSQGWIEVNWNEVCQGPLYSVYYRVYRSIPPDDVKTPVSEWQTSLSFDDMSIEPGVSYAYWVRTATSNQGDDASDYGGPADTSGSHESVLMLSSTAGGSVTVPGEGTFPVNGRTITVTATPIDSSLFFFAGWTGSAVDAGQVSHPAQSSTLVTVDSNSTLRAHFMSFMDVLYVDDDASNGPQENGTAPHPFDRIQEAIEVASKGATIVIRPGLYRENIDLLGKNVRLTGLDPNGSPLPIIEGRASGPVVSFTRGEDQNCTLTGLVITSGPGQQTGAIACVRSSPTLTNCLIVGNRATGGNGAAIHCQDSQARFVNCTIANNVADPPDAAIVLVNSQVTVSNSIVWDNTPSQIVLRGDSGPSIIYNSVAGGWPDAGNIEADPLFACPGYWADPDRLKTEVDPSRPDAVWVGGDYHLKSRAGRWDPQIRVWVQDNVTSPCIDAGDPAAPVGDEPPPHGHIINLGAYGGTSQASKGQ